MNQSAISELTFSAVTENIQTKILIETIKKYIGSHKDLRILDLGCGAGSGLLKISNLLSQGTLVGVDISKSSIEQARRMSLEDKSNNEIAFEACDYLTYNAEPFDIIYSDSVLQNIDCSTEKLFEKISRDLKLNGILILTMPYECLYNRFLYGLRSLLKLFHGKYLDQIILTIAKWIYPKVDTKTLQERIPYMYMLPSRVDSSTFREQLAKKFQLESLQVSALPNVSVAKAKHHLIVLKKLSAS